MSTQLLEPVAGFVPRQGLHEIEDYAAGESLPDVPWLTRLDLDSPRINVRCLSAGTRVSKRCVDVVLSLALLVLLSPLMLLTALMVKLTSSGPVIFRQTRVGLNLRSASRDRRRGPSSPPEETGERRGTRPDRRLRSSYGRHFTLYKFRTMRVDAERDGARFAVKGDPRITPIGRFLRRTRIDELPQLWNVLKGEMSLVGPRPERPEFIQQLSDEIPDYLARLGLQPGLTGVAQIVNGYDNNLDSFRRKVAFDLLYLQHCCAWNDFKILLRTIRVVLTGSGAL